MQVKGLSLRQMVASDAVVVAHLHLASWQTAYRGVLSDDYLAVRAEGERLRHWKKRLGAPTESQFGLVAEYEGVPTGFAFVVAEADPRYGNLLDNLHVVTAM